MPLIDLQPMTKDAVHEKGLTPHQLWLVKIGEQIYGPFETESLRHYSLEHQTSFEEALVSRMENYDWQPFFSQAQFQRKEGQFSKPKNHQYWLLLNAQKSGPFSIAELEKKLISQEVSLADLISQDNGDSWHKIYQDRAFDSKRHVSQELPLSPTDASFQKAKLELVEKAQDETPAATEQETLASLAYLGQLQEKTTTPKLDEFTLGGLGQTHVSGSLKWAIPTAVSMMVAVAFVGHSLLSSFVSEDSEEVAEAASAQKAEVILPKSNSLAAPAYQQEGLRRPASTQADLSERSALTRTDYDSPSSEETASAQPHYEDTHQETIEHSEGAREHSLLSPPPANLEEFSNGEQPLEPVREVASEPTQVEEVSDF